MIDSGHELSDITYEEAERIIRQVATKKERTKRYLGDIPDDTPSAEKKTVAFGNVTGMVALANGVQDNHRDPGLPPCNVCDRTTHIARDCTSWLASKGVCTQWRLHDIGVRTQPCSYGANCKFAHKTPANQPTYADCLEARKLLELHEDKKKRGGSDPQEETADEADSVETQRSLPSSKPNGPRKAIAAHATTKVDKSKADDSSSEPESDDDSGYTNRHRMVLWAAP